MLAELPIRPDSIVSKEFSTVEDTSFKSCHVDDDQKSHLGYAYKDDAPTSSIVFL